MHRISAVGRRSLLVVMLLSLVPAAEAEDRRGAGSKHSARDRTGVARKDLQIKALIARIHTLERRLAALEQGALPSTGAAASAPAAPVNTSAGDPLPAAVRSAANIEKHPSTRTPADAPATADDAMARALERALVREGGLVLPPGAVEIEPRLRYQHRATRGVELIKVGGQPQLAQVGRRLELSQLGLGLRLGLPRASQFELFIPYASNRLHADVSGATSEVERASGIGSIEVGWTGQLLSRPNGTGLLSSLRYVGQVPLEQLGSAVAVGSSFRTWQASLLLVTRLDPVVFLVGVSRSFQQSRELGAVRIHPGNATGVRAGAIIALSPDSSLRFGLEISRSGDTTLSTGTVAASGSVAAEFSTGFSFVLTPRTLLGIEAGIGLTPSSPDFRIGLSLPMRF